MRILKTALIALALCLAQPVAAGPFEDGLAAYRQKNYAVALRFWRKLANQGFVRAQASLGSMYDQGQGVCGRIMRWQ